MQSESIHEICNGIMSFIDRNPESPCIVNLFGAKREIPKWMKDLGSEVISTSLGHAMDILKDKDRYNGKAVLYGEERDNPEISFCIPFIDYGSIDADRITEDWRHVHWVRQEDVMKTVEKGYEDAAILVVLNNDEETLMEQKLNGIPDGSGVLVLDKGSLRDLFGMEYSVPDGRFL